METTNAKIISTEFSVDIEGARAAVWSALTEDIGSWWPEDSFGGGEKGSRSFSLDPQPGGLMKESWDGGGGLVWGTVTTVDPGTLLQVMGATFPNWGGPTFWFGTWTLEEKDRGTRLTFHESGLGRFDPKTREGNDKGWHFLFAQALKAHVESKPAPQWKG